MESEVVVIKKEKKGNGYGEAAEKMEVEEAGDRGEEKEKNKSMGKNKKSKDEKNEEKQENKNGQDKFFVDVSKDAEAKELISKLLAEANNKSFGREIIFKDIALAGLAKLTTKDLEKIQDNALSDMQRVERLLHEHNEKNKTSLTLGEFLVKKLNISKEEKLGK
jgi:hypothetical protein